VLAFATIETEVKHTEINDELKDLHDCDVLLPPDADSTSRLEVVPVHDNVNHQVERDWYPRNRRASNELGIAKKSSSTMMIGMEEGCQLSVLIYSPFQENILNGFFLRNKKTVSINSRYFVK
jgi:hypothetical protein